jgi:hypothetical protein
MPQAGVHRIISGDVPHDPAENVTYGLRHIAGTAWSTKRYRAVNGTAGQGSASGNDHPAPRRRPVCILSECESADVRDPFLRLRLACSSGLRRKLKHCCFLIFQHVSQQHGDPVWKFQSIMMCSRVVLVDLPEDGRRMSDGNRLPGK